MNNYRIFLALMVLLSLTITATLWGISSDPRCIRRIKETVNTNVCRCCDPIERARNQSHRDSSAILCNRSRESAFEVDDEQTELLSRFPVAYDVIKNCETICDRLMTACFKPSQTVLYYGDAAASQDPDRLFQQEFSPYVRTSNVKEMKLTNSNSNKYFVKRKRCLVTDLDPNLSTIRKQSRCAIVGNGGILVDSSCGREIDGYDFVLRSNLATLEGYSTDVGTKTHMMLINMEILNKMFKTFTDKKSSQVEARELFRYLRSLNGSILWYPKGTKPYGTNKKLATIANGLSKVNATVKVAFSMTESGRDAARIIKTKKYASSGLIMYHVATALCSNITLYGFYPYDKSPSGRQLSHHYYEPNLTTFKTKMHDFNAEFKHFTALHEKKSIRLVKYPCL